MRELVLEWCGKAPPKAKSLQKRTKRARSELRRVDSLSFRLALVLAISLGGGTAAAGSRAFVEIGDTGDHLNPVITRRLVALELSEVSVPGNPRIAGDDERDVTLHCRVLPENGALRVEVWDRGEQAGARLVSLQGTQSLVARRVALAAAELARRLAHTRKVEARRLEREAEEAALAVELAKERAQRERLALAAGVEGAWFWQGAYLAGPRAAAQLNRDHPLRVEFGLSWLNGQITELEGSPFWSALEIDVSPAWVVPLTPRMDLSLGATLRAATLHTSSAVTVDRIAGQKDTWLARGGFEARLQPRLSSRLRLDLGLAAGLVFREVSLERTDSAASSFVESMRLRGAWGGLSIGVLLD